MTSATVGQAGAAGFVANSPKGEVSQVGLTAFVEGSPNAKIAQAGLLAWVTLLQPYEVAQVGAQAFGTLKSQAEIGHAGLAGFSKNGPAALVAQSGLLAWVSLIPSPGPAALAVTRKLGTPIDVAMVYDPNLRALDGVFTGTDFAIDETPASVLLHSLLVNRRAHPDDTWPTPVPDWANPSSFTARGGYPGDALDPNGQLSGSRLYLLDRRLADDQARSDCQDYLVEAVEPLESQRGYAIQLQAAYEAPQILGYSVTVGSTTVALKKLLN